MSEHNSEQIRLTQHIKEVREIATKLDSIARDAAGTQSQITELEAKVREIDKQIEVIRTQTAQSQEDQKKMNELILQNQAAEKEKAEIRHNIVTRELKLQSQYREAEEAKRLRQGYLKQTFFALKETLEEYVGRSEKLLRFLLLQELHSAVRRHNLSPAELEEIEDKEYADDVLEQLEKELKDAQSLLTPDDHNDLQLWQKLPAEIGALRNKTQAEERRLDSLPNQLDQKQLELDQFERRELEHAPEREKSASEAKKAFYAASLLGILAIILFFLGQWAGNYLAIIGSGILLIPCLLLIGYSVWRRMEHAKLDFSDEIRSARQEVQQLQSESAGIPEAAARLKADKGQLEQLEGNLKEVYARYPELHGFQLPSFDPR